MIIFREKVYSTTQQLIKDNAGELEQGLIHLLKLKYKFNLENDKRKHTSDLWNDFLKDTLERSWKEKLNSDRQRLQRVSMFLENRSKKHTIGKATKEFRDRYGWSKRDIVTDSDYSECFKIFEELLMSKSKSEYDTIVSKKLPNLYK